MELSVSVVDESADWGDIGWEQSHFEAFTRGATCGGGDREGDFGRIFKGRGVCGARQY